MTGTQLDLFGAVEATEDAAQSRAAEIARLQYERELADTCLGWGLYRESVDGWPNGKPVGADAAIAAWFDEDERAKAGHITPGKQGSCRACHHQTVRHLHCQFSCSAPGCGCRALTDPVYDHLEVTVLPGAIVSVRSVADIIAERWEAYETPWPGAAEASRHAMETIA